MVEACIGLIVTLSLLFPKLYPIFYYEFPRPHTDYSWKITRLFHKLINIPDQFYKITKNETAKNTTSPHNTKICHILRLLNCKITDVSITSWRLAFWVSEKEPFKTENTLSAPAEVGCITANLQAAADQWGYVLLWFFQNVQSSWDESTTSHAAM